MSFAIQPEAVSVTGFEAEDIRIAYRLTQDVAARFATSGQDLADAQLAASRAISAYLPRDNAEMIHAARLVALSMTELDFLRAASLPDMDPVIRMRLVGFALRLEKAVVTSQRALRQEQRLAKAPAASSPDMQPAGDPPAAPPDPAPEEPPAPADAERTETATRPSRPAMMVREAKPGAALDVLADEAPMGLEAMMQVGMARFLAAQEALMGQTVTDPPDGGG